MFHREKVREWHRRSENAVIYSKNPKLQSTRKGFEGNKDRLTRSELRLGRPREQDMGGSGHSEGRLKVLSLQGSEQEGS